MAIIVAVARSDCNSQLGTVIRRSRLARSRATKLEMDLPENTIPIHHEPTIWVVGIFHETRDITDRRITSEWEADAAISIMFAICWYGHFFLLQMYHVNSPIMEDHFSIGHDKLTVTEFQSW
jgi:hypothetical protein